MSTQIKVRAWNKEANKMVDLHSITPLALSDTMSTVMAQRGSSGVFIPFDTEIIIMQYTGLDDINGINIYEGDICKFEGSYIYPVMFERGTFYTYSHSDFDPLYKFESIEVVGNIYQNEELLHQDD